MESQIPSSVACVTVRPSIEEFEDFPRLIQQFEERQITFALVSKHRWPHVTAYYEQLLAIINKILNLITETKAFVIKINSF